MVVLHTNNASCFSETVNFTNTLSLILSIGIRSWILYCDFIDMFEHNCPIYIHSFRTVLLVYEINYESSYRGIVGDERRNLLRPYSEDCGSIFLRNFDTHLTYLILPYPNSWQHETSPPWKLCHVQCTW